MGKIVGLIITLCILLIISALCSAAEIAYTSMNIVRLKHLASKGKKSARRALKLNENYDRLLSTLLIGNNVVNITAASLATIIFVFYFGDAGVTISTIVMATLVMLLGDITPKSIAKERPEAFAMFISLPLSIFIKICTPLNWLFDTWKKFLKKILRLEKQQPVMTEEEFKIMVSDIKDDGVLTATEHKLIHNTLKYDELLVSDVMTPIDEATMIEFHMPNRDIKNLFETTNYSRIPVYKSKKHNIIGVLYRADFYEMLLNERGTLKSIIKKVFWVGPNIKITTLFAKFQKRKQHIAMVGAESKLYGLVTLDDIIAELVGETEDENDE